ncbi:Hypothetical_protein [Hexamita inflata]|uniref:Hypothetical_protein n=1 Tax=Hexamita inflata TaxID=28002 RepID=A0AA86UX42_9EUKA|nr:Hypothetical protein HINF_LOCUS63060 [Hexamita inflata]
MRCIAIHTQTNVARTEMTRCSITEVVKSASKLQNNIINIKCKSKLDLIQFNSRFEMALKSALLDLNKNANSQEVCKELSAHLKVYNQTNGMEQNTVFHPREKRKSKKSKLGCQFGRSWSQLSRLWQELELLPQLFS